VAQPSAPRRRTTRRPGRRRRPCEPRVISYRPSHSTDPPGTIANASTAIETIEAAIATAVDAAAQFGSLQNRLGIQDEFVKALTDALSEGVGILVDTNMDEEAARLNALQVQQQLGVQSLSIANSVPHSIVALFR
jgi:flagellin